MVKINYVKKFNKGTHRTIVSVTVTPSWFARVFRWAKPEEFAFIGWGTNWVPFYQAEDERPSVHGSAPIKHLPPQNLPL